MLFRSCPMSSPIQSSNVLWWQGVLEIPKALRKRCSIQKALFLFEERTEKWGLNCVMGNSEEEGAIYSFLPNAESVA